MRIPIGADFAINKSAINSATEVKAYTRTLILIVIILLLLIHCHKIYCHKIPSLKIRKGNTKKNICESMESKVIVLVPQPV